MRIFKGEFLKIFGRTSFLIAFLFLLAVNAILLLTVDSDVSYDKKDYRDVYAAMNHMSAEDKNTFIQTKYENLKCNDEYSAQYELFETLNQELETIHNYPNYLKAIKERAQKSAGISIFQTQDAFSMRNAEKTVKAFEGLESIHLELNNSNMINQMTNFSPTDILLLLLVFMICSFLLMEEKENGLFWLLKPLKHARARLMLGKILSLLISVIVICFIFFTENYLISGQQYGFANLTLPLQSISGYSGSALHVTAGQYLLLYFISKVIAFIVLGLCFLQFSLSVKAIHSYYIRVIIFLGVSFFFYAVIPENSILQILRYVNIIEFIQVTPVYQYYFNLNIMGVPIEMCSVFWAASFLCILLFTLLLMLGFSKQEMTAFSSKTNLSHTFRQKRVHTGIFYHEAYKLFITNKVFFLLLLFAAFQLYAATQKSSYLPFDEYYYKQYMSALEGPLNHKSMSLIEKEEKRFRDLDQLVEDAQRSMEKGDLTEREVWKTRELVQEQTKGRNAFERVKERRDYLIAHEKKYGKSLEFVYESGWDYLFGREYTPYKNDMFQAITLLLVIIIAFSGIFSMESSTQMIRILLCCKQGRRYTAKIKLLICTGIATLFFILNYLPEILHISAVYGLNQWGSSLYCIPSLADFPLDISIGGYLIVLFAVRYLVILCAVSIILGVSLYAKNMIGSIFILLFFMVSPLLIDLLGIGIIRHFSFNRFFSGNAYLDEIAVNPVNTFALLFPLLAGIVALRTIGKKFQE